MDGIQLFRVWTTDKKQSHNIKIPKQKSIVFLLDCKYMQTKVEPYTSKQAKIKKKIKKMVISSLPSSLTIV